MSSLTSNVEGILSILSGPSGVGKTTIVNRLDGWSGFKKVVTLTTRTPRPGEINGIDYLFVDIATFHRTPKLESAVVHSQKSDSDRWYGTPVEPTLGQLNTGGRLIMAIDVQGHEKLRRTQIQDRILSFFIDLPDDDIVRRLRDRPGGVTAEEVERRLASAASERKYAGQFDIRITNHDHQLEQTIASIKDLIGRRVTNIRCYR